MISLNWRTLSVSPGNILKYPMCLRGIQGCSTLVTVAVLNSPALHSELVVNGYALVAAPELSFPKFKYIKDLKFLDGVAIRWHGSIGFMKKSSKSVLNAGKVLILSRTHDVQQYKFSRYWLAQAGCVHGDLAKLFEMEPEITKKWKKLHFHDFPGQLLIFCACKA